MKVSIIGGGGLVGSSAAFALQCGGIVSQIDLIDLNADQVRGQALDLLHGASLVADQRIRATGYEAIPESDVVIITAGLRRKPDESRLDLINRNVELFLGILGQVAAAGLKRDAIVLVVSNPVDVLTYLAVRQLDLPPSQVIGLGTAARHGAVPQPDRRRAPAAAHPGHRADPGRARRQHGPDLVDGPGRRLAAREVPRLDFERRPTRILTRTRGSGAEVIKLKGGAGFAVGLSIREVVHAVALDQKRILPVSSLVNGPYGIRDVCISVPTVVGRKGVEAQLEIELWPKEISALQHSAQVLRETIEAVYKSNPKAAGKAKAGAAGLPGGQGRRRRTTAAAKPGSRDDGRRRRQRRGRQFARHDLRAREGRR